MGGGVSLEPARTGRLPPKLGGLVSGFTFYQFGIMLWPDCRFPFFFFFLSTCRMARGQEETSTSQAGRK